MKRHFFALVIMVTLVAPTAPADPPGVQATDVRFEITSFHIHNYDSLDDRYVRAVAELKNVGTSIVKDIDCTVDLYDGTDYVDRIYVSVYFDHLRPGETTPLYAWTDIPIDRTIDRVVWHPGGDATTEQPYDPPTTILQSDERRSDGHFELRGEVQNSGSENMIIHSVVVSFYNGAGQIIGVDKSWVSLIVDWIVVPGARYPYCANFEEPEWTASWKLQVSAEPTSAFPLPLEFSNVSDWRDQYGDVHIAGDLRNPTDVSTGDIKMLAVLRDAQGKFVRHTCDSLNPLSGGDSVHFDIQFWVWADLTYDSYEIQAQCETTTAGPMPSVTPTLTPSPSTTLTPLATATLTPTPSPTLCADPFEPDGSYEQAKVIVVNGVEQQHSVFPSEDVDYVKFTAQAGWDYAIRTFDLVGPGNDTQLTLYDTDGVTILAENNDDPAAAPASKIDWRCPATGTYFAMVKQFDPAVGGCNVTYRIQLVGGLTGVTPTPVAYLYLPIAVRN